MDITALPNDIFLLIIEYLSPLELILSRAVCKQFYAAFTESDLNRHVTQKHYPRARELREVTNEDPINWSDTFARVAARYHHLKTGKPRSIEKLALGKSLVLPKWARHYPIHTWHQYLQFEEKVATFHYPDPLWTYDAGILIFPSVEMQSYVLYDLQACKMKEIDANYDDKIVRRIRLKKNVLVIEWCEQDAYHQLNENETVYRHFATAYDLIQDEQKEWATVFRNEWKIHFLGMPLNSKDRFFSSHSASHYAIYLWQPNRSAWGEDDPIESLAIWDISSPSQYRPSEDPAGKMKNFFETEGARIIRRLNFPDLDFYQIRQRSTPVLRGLELDENNVYLIEEDHRWLVGQEASHNLPRLHKVKSVGIPFYDGPRWEDSCGADGDVNLSFCQRATDSRHPSSAPCWRHEEFPYLTVTEAFDEEAGVKFSARHCFMLETLSINVKPRVHMTGPGYEISLKDDLWSQLLGSGRICGDERWLIGENSNQEIVILLFDRKGRRRPDALNPVDSELDGCL